MIKSTIADERGCGATPLLKKYPNTITYIENNDVVVLSFYVESCCDGDVNVYCPGVISMMSGDNGVVDLEYNRHKKHLTVSVLPKHVYRSKIDGPRGIKRIETLCVKGGDCVEVELMEVLISGSRLSKALGIEISQLLGLLSQSVCEVVIGVSRLGRIEYMRENSVVTKTPQEALFLMDKWMSPEVVNFAGSNIESQ